MRIFRLNLFLHQSHYLNPRPIKGYWHFKIQKRERERERETDRQRDRETDRELLEVNCSYFKLLFFFCTNHTTSISIKAISGFRDAG